MKANYTRDQVTVKALIMALNKINMLLYSEFFNKQQRACISFTKLIDKYACEYNDKYEGFAHETALAESLKKQGIVIRLSCLTEQVYKNNRERIRFYLGLTAKALLQRRKSVREVKIYLNALQKLIARCDWTTGKASRELDEMLLSSLNLIYSDGVAENCEVGRE